MERVWSSWARDGVMQFTGLYFAVLGGAYSSLAKANSHYVSVLYLSEPRSETQFIN